MKECPECKQSYDPLVYEECPNCHPAESDDSAPPPPPPPMESEEGGIPPPPMGEVAPASAPKKDPDTNYGRTANCSSRVDRLQLDRFVGGLVDNDIGFPVFSVCDCNSFHTTGYLWGLYAVKMLIEKGRPKAPVAVINFDQHDDYGGSMTYHSVRSDGWGASMLDRLFKFGFNGSYLTVGNGKSGDNRIYVKGREYSRESVKDFNKAFWNKIIGKLERPYKYVFITIDRDCFKDSYTQWGDGFFQGTDQLIAKMKEVLEPLIKACLEHDPKNIPELIGFDITGQPEHGMLQGNTSKKPADTWKDLDEQLVKIKAWISTFYATQMRRIKDQEISLGTGKALEVTYNRFTVKWSKVVFFSGSVSYARDKAISYPRDKNFEDQVGKDYAIKDWRYPDYVWWVGRNLKRMLTGEWKYILCRQAAPVFSMGWKEFRLYRPKESVVISLEEKMSNTLKFPKNIMPHDTVMMVVEALGDPVELGGFASTASMSTTGRFVIIPKELKKAFPEYVIFDPVLNRRGEFKEAK